MYYTVYILYSDKFDRIYIGFTSHLINRFYSHNTLSPKGYTSKWRPWRVIYCEFYENKSQALKREMQLKSAGHRRIIRNKIAELPQYGFISA